MIVVLRSESSLDNDPFFKKNIGFNETTFVHKMSGTYIPYLLAGEEVSLDKELASQPGTWLVTPLNQSLPNDVLNRWTTINTDFVSYVKGQPTSSTYNYVPYCECAKDKFKFTYHEKWCRAYVNPMTGEK
jgi:hypothetical protein